MASKNLLKTHLLSVKNWRIGGSVGGDAILCKQSVPRAERPSYARRPVAFPSVATAHRQRIRGSVGGDASQRRNSAYVAGVTLGSVTSYNSA